MWKRIVSIVFVLFIFHLTTKALDVNINHIFYRVDSEALTAIAIGTDDQCEGAVIIPEEFSAWSKTYRVIGIADNAFRSHLGITSVSIAESVATIGDGAFDSCKNLTSVKLPSQLDTIKDNTFAECGLLTIEIPHSVKSIGKRAFGRCFSLSFIELSDNVETIGDHAFGRCTALKSVTIPGNGKTTNNPSC